MSTATLHELIATQVRQRPNGTAVLAPGHKPLTYLRLQVQIDYVRDVLSSLRIRRNDRVALVLPNGPESAVMFLATAAGATSAPLNPDFTQNEFEYFFSGLDAKALVVAAGKDSPARAVALVRDIPIIELVVGPEREAGMFSLEGAKSQQSGISPEVQAMPDDIALVLHTSGTTSDPKLVPLTHRNICASAASITAVLRLGERDCCLNVMPLYHSHGLIAAVLASLAAGGSVVCTSGFSALDFFQNLDAFKPTWYTAAPAIHQAVLNYLTANDSRLADCSLRLIRSASSPLPPKVMSQLEEVFGVPVIESYGMTETATQITSNLLPPGKRKPGSAGLAAGTTVAIVGPGFEQLGIGQVGEVVIQGKNLMNGYLNEQRDNNSEFTNGWFRTGDQGYIDSEGFLYLTGRTGELINRGGEKISPREIDETLMNYPGVLQVAAFAVPHPTLGEDIGVAVVLAEGKKVSTQELREYAFSQLADYKVPNRVVFIGDIPRGPVGKVDRMQLAEKFAFNRPSVHIAPRNAWERLVADIYSAVLGIARIGVEDNFFYLGGDSLSAMQAVSRIRAILDTPVESSDLFRMPTVAELARHIELACADSGGAVPTCNSANSEAISKSDIVPRTVRDQSKKLSSTDRNVHLRQDLEKFRDR